MSTTTLTREGNLKNDGLEDGTAINELSENRSLYVATTDTNQDLENNTADYDDDYYSDISRSEQEGFALSKDDENDDFEPFILGEDESSSAAAHGSHSATANGIRRQATDETGAEEEELGRTVEEAIEVEVPLSTAYNQWTLFEEFPKFIDNIDNIAQLDDTTLLWRVSFGGVEREFEVAITEQTPDQRIAWKALEGKMHTGSISFEPLDQDRTRLYVVLNWDPNGFIEKAGARFNIDKNEIQKALANFKEFIENRPFEEGAWRGEVVDNDDSSAIASMDREPALAR